MEWSREKVVEEIVREVVEQWELQFYPVKFVVFARRWNKVAARLGFDLRELVRSEPRLLVQRTQQGGLVLFPNYAPEAVGPDWANVLQAHGLPIS